MYDVSNPLPPVDAKVDAVRFCPRPDQGLPCWVVLPLAPAPGAPPLVAVHGLNRGAEEQARLFGALATRLGRTVIAPLFPRKDWPSYQQVVRRGRADLALLDLLEDLRLTGIVDDGPVDLFGYSGGAQFAHRFALLYPHRIRSLSIAAAGWYTFPDVEAYPYGMSAAGRYGRWGAAMAAGLEAFLSLDIRVLVGSDDDTVDETTRTLPALDAQQGRTRLERAGNWVRALREAARARGLPDRVSMHVLQRCGHSFEDCVRIGGLDRLVLAGSNTAQTRPIRKAMP